MNRILLFLIPCCLLLPGCKNKHQTGITYEVIDDSDTAFADNESVYDNVPNYYYDSVAVISGSLSQIIIIPSKSDESPEAVGGFQCVLERPVNVISLKDGLNTVNNITKVQLISDKVDLTEYRTKSITIKGSFVSTKEASIADVLFEVLEIKEL